MATVAHRLPVRGRAAVRGLADPAAGPDDPEAGPAARGRPHRQLRPQPPVHARRAAADRRPARRARRRARSRDRLPAHRLREDDGAEDVVEGRHLSGPRRLRLLPVQRARLRARGREAAAAAGAAQGDLDADGARRAGADPLAPRLPRHLRARDRGDLDVLVLLPRARPRARPLRDGRRDAHAHALLPGRRPRRGHPGRLLRRGAQVLRADAEGGRRVRGDPQLEQDLARADGRRRRALGRGRDRARADRAEPPRLRRRLGPAQARAVPRLRPGRFRRARLRRAATSSTATRCASTRCASRCGSSSSASTGSSRCRASRGSRTTARSCCRRARSCTPRWSR